MVILLDLKYDIIGEELHHSISPAHRHSVVLHESQRGNVERDVERTTDYAYFADNQRNEGNHTVDNFTNDLYNVHGLEYSTIHCMLRTNGIHCS